jgi:nickel-dependent lactate racemase
LVLASDRILVITSVEPHYFAGFMGGRKSFLPGLASYETIAQNHRLALHRMARTFSLLRNPVHNDMMEALGYLDNEKVFSIQLLQDPSGKVIDSLAGDIRTTFFTLATFARRLHGARVGTKADILLTVVSNPELSLYESRKAISYGLLGLKKGGILIVVSPCKEGLGNPEFFEPIIGSRSPRDLIRHITGEFRLGHQRLAKWIEAPLWGEIMLVSDLPPASVTDLFLTPYGSASDACKEALRKKGRSSTLTVVFDGTRSIPLLE